MILAGVHHEPVREHERRIAGKLQPAPEMTALAGLLTSFAALLVPGPGNDARLGQWITDARAADLPPPCAPSPAALTWMNGRAGFTLGNRLQPPGRSYSSREYSYGIL